ncbi:MAG: hypothetical protein RX318_03380 [bacterium]|nr:hypothetical protein [bacterium]
MEQQIAHYLRFTAASMYAQFQSQVAIQLFDKPYYRLLPDERLAVNNAAGAHVGEILQFLTPDILEDTLQRLTQTEKPVGFQRPEPPKDPKAESGD